MTTKRTRRPARRARDHRQTDAQVTAVMDAVRRLFRAARAAAQTAERRLGISGAQHYVLQQLATAPASSLNELAARTHTHKSSVSVVVSRLVERGLVRRRASPSDGRVIELGLTPAGRAALRRAPDSAQTRFVRVLERMAPADLAALATHLGRFTEALGIQALPPSMIFEEDAS